MAQAALLLSGCPESSLTMHPNFESGGGMQRKVLIADDDPAMIRLLTHILTGIGLEVISEDNGLSALDTARLEKPDLLLLDLMMPHLDGFGVLMRLYGDDPPFASPAILLTAQDAAEYRHIAEALGAVRFIEKPFNLEKFVATVRDVLGD